MHWENPNENKLFFSEKIKGKIDAGVLNKIGMWQMVMREK